MWTPPDRCLSSTDRSETWMPAVTLPILTGHWLGVEDILIWVGKWYLADSSDSAQWHVFCSYDMVLLSHIQGTTISNPARPQVVDSGRAPRYRSGVITPTDQLVIAVEDNAGQEGGGSVLLNPVKELSGELRRLNNLHHAAGQALATVRNLYEKTCWQLI